MKNFFKKLSFVLASAMVITSLYAPANTEAASKNFVREKGSKKAVTSKDIFVGGRKVNFDYTIGKKMTGIHGTWKSSDTSVAVVDKKTGLVKGVGNGEATISFKTKKTKTMKKSYTIKTKVNVFTRAEKVELPATAEVKMGESTELMAKLIAYAKAGSSVPTYNLVVTSSDEKIATVVEDGNKLTVMGKAAGEATLTVYARHKGGDKYDTPKVEVKVTVKGNISAAQVGSNKIKVTGMDLSNDVSLYVLKNAQGATFTIKKDSLKVNEAKTEAEFETEVGVLRKNTYKLSYNKGEEVSFNAEEAKSAKIEFLPADKAVLQTGDTRAKVFYKVLDQFGNDITKSNVIDLSINGNEIVDKAKRGEITFERTAKFKPYVDMVFVTIVDLKNPSTTVSGQFKIDAESNISEVNYKGLFDAKTNKFIDSFKQDLKGDIARLFILFEVKDQYGRPIDKTFDANLKKDLSVNVISATGLEKMKDDTTTTHAQEVGGVKYLAYQLKASAADLRSGEVQVQAISTKFGKTTSGKFNVTDKLKVDTISFSIGSNDLFAGQENELLFTAYDVNGVAVTDVDALNEAIENANLPGTGSTLKFEKNIKGKPVLKFKPMVDDLGAAGTNNSQTVYITGITKTLKSYQIPLSVRNKKVVSDFLGLREGVVRGATSGNDLKIKASDLRFKDQHGYDMTDEEVVKLGTIKVIVQVYNDDETTKGAKNFEVAASDPVPATDIANEVSEATIVKDMVILNVKATENKEGTDKVAVTVKGLPDGKENKRVFTIKNVSLARMDKFEVKSPDLVPVTDIYAATTSIGPKVYGFDKDDDKIKVELKADQYQIRGGATPSSFNRPSKADLNGATTREENFVVVIAGGKTVNGKYTVSTAPSMVASVKKNAGATFTGAGNAKYVLWDGDTTVTDLKLKEKFEIKDQYGQVLTNATPYITYTFTNDDMKKLFDNDGLKNNGFVTAGFKFKSGGAKVKPSVRLDFPGVGVKFDELIEFEE